MHSDMQRNAQMRMFQDLTSTKGGDSAVTGLLIDNDTVYARELQRSFQQRGISIIVASSGRKALAAATARPPEFALVGLRLGKESGLELIEPLKTIRADTRILLIAGYASITSAVEAIKRGADNYLLKPVTVEVILRALDGETIPQPEPATTMAPLSRLQWERIHQVLNDTNGNISAAARLLGMHRRSLQRKLAKRPRLVTRELAAGLPAQD